jgi:hypothetical protein
MLEKILPVFKVRIEDDPALSPHFQLTLDQLYYRMSQLYRANANLDAKALGLLQIAGLILALIGALKFPAALYSNDLWVKAGIAVGFLAFAGMVFLTLSAWTPKGSFIPGPSDWDEIYDGYITVELDKTFDQILSDGLHTQSRLLELNRYKSDRLKWSTLLFFLQLAGLLLLALAS